MGVIGCINGYFLLVYPELINTLFDLDIIYDDILRL